ncbi:uncharacterized protein ACIBXB_003644 [Morphnus guianensis]
MRNKTKSQNTCPPPLPSFQAQLHSQILFLPHPAAQGDRDGVYDQFITRYFCCFIILRGRTHHTLPLLQCGVPPTGDSPPRTSPMWVLPMGCSSSRTAPAQVPSTACSPSGAHCSSVGPPQGHKSCQKTCSSVGSSLHASAGPARSLLQRGVPTGSQPPLGTHLLRRGDLPGLQVEICSTVDLHGLQGDSLPHRGLPHGLQGNLCSGAWSISSPSFFTDLGVCRVVSLTCSHSSLRLPFPSVPTFFFLLKNVLPEALPLLLIGLALAGGGSVLEPAGIGSVGHRGSFQQLLTEATPVTPPPPPRDQNLATQTQYTHSRMPTPKIPSPSSTLFEGHHQEYRHHRHMVNKTQRILKDGPSASHEISLALGNGSFEAELIRMALGTHDPRLV